MNLRYAGPCGALGVDFSSACGSGDRLLLAFTSTARLSPPNAPRSDSPRTQSDALTATVRTRSCHQVDRARPLRAGGGALTHNADADLTSVRVSNIFPHQWAALHVEVESLVKSARIGGLRRIREGKPIMEWDSKLRRMVATPLHDSCLVVMDTRERAERLVHALAECGSASRSGPARRLWSKPPGGKSHHPV